MKRVKTLVGSILATVSHGITTLVLLVYMLSLDTLILQWEMASGYAFVGEGTLYAILIFALLVALTSLILNSIAIRTWKQDISTFKKSKGLLVAATVFNFIIFSGLSIAAAILYIVDLAQEKKRGEVTPVEETKTTTAVPELADSAVQLVKEDKLAAAEAFSQKLTKLDMLKKKGILTEEEYSEIKKTYVKDYLGQ